MDQVVTRVFVQSGQEVVPGQDIYEYSHNGKLCTVQAHIKGRIDYDDVLVRMGACSPGSISIRTRATSKPLDVLLEELYSLVGMESIKQDIQRQVDFLKIQAIRSAMGFPSTRLSHHMVFSGNPGTGKTTVARILSGIYREIGILSKGHLIETDRSGLVSGFLGQTALKTRERLDEALGGILFIDEAYSLCSANRSDSFGLEAIDTIVKYMEDNRGDLIVIVAGYEEEMRRFIASNPGLKSRFSNFLHFPDYSLDELQAMFNIFAARQNYKLCAGCVASLRKACEAIRSSTAVTSGNGRAVRNLFERAIINHASRVARLSLPSRYDLEYLGPEDISA
ncbi:AAA family ATPase [Synechococcus sp. CBW1004]|uniref:AAA family ATPase n=1 Tax=Synechococcus sp. CBW1004 TaxID=1353136 RepID=UPI0018CD93AB|nr:AAA family ATPase [Synechococcus sp. CBW1004]QPN61967.1 AAA family ATPase [Synechococcus sp. CBW1004]